MSSVIEDTENETIDADTGSQRFAHYANSVSVTEGYITGKPIVAICGKVFVPSRDPEKFPICPICKELADALMLGKE